MRFGIFFALALLPVFAQRPTPIIIDTDIGDSIDDAFALALALRSPEVDVRAVTTVTDDVESRTRFVVKQLGVFGRRGIAVGIGAPEPLLDPIQSNHAAEFTILTAADQIPPAARRRAAELIVETLLASPDKITLVPIGPLTNIALALKTEPRIKAKIQRIVLMGGAYTMNQPEYNIQRDHAAAQIVFQSGLPITAVGLDVTLKCKLRPKDLDRLRLADGPAAHFMMRLLELARNESKEDFPTLHDPLAMAVVFHPELVDLAEGRVTVTAEGVTKFTAAAGASTQVAREVRVDNFLDLLTQRLTALR